MGFFSINCHTLYLIIKDFSVKGVKGVDNRFIVGYT